MRIAGFPGVVGAINGTHVCIIAPTVNDETYFNRKGFHSISVQVVFDANYKILDLVPKWPGSTHDAWVLSQSGLIGLFEQNYVRPGCHLLGDSGYPLKRCLLTPYRRPQGEEQLNYDRAHKVTRAVIERGIGQLKRRFHVLHGEIRQCPERASHIIIACGILHNICKARNLPLLDDDDAADEDDNDHDDDDSDENDDNTTDHALQNISGRASIRDCFANLHFGDSMSSSGAGPCVNPVSCEAGSSGGHSEMS